MERETQRNDAMNFEKTKLGLKLGQLMIRNRITQKQLAEGSDISQTSIVKLRSKGMRPGPETLHKICNCSSISADDQIELVIEHLRDEMHRAGKSQESVEIAVARIDSFTDAIQRDADRIADVARDRKDIAELLHGICRMVSGLKHTDPPI
jgi:transcriptional regulator with XRE-family HTH domain